MSTSPLKLVADCHAECGEGPLWHVPSRTLIFTDIVGCRMLRYDPATKKCETFRTSKGRVGGFTFEPDGSMILFEEQQVIHRANDGKERILWTVPQGNPDRFNDQIADPEGRVYVGTMGLEKHDGALIRIDPGGKASVLMEGITCGNGMGFTRDGKRFYFTDTLPPPGRIYIFDYDRKTGNLGNRRVFAQVPGEEGYPDGLTVDSEDHVWSARWGGSAVVRYRPDGSVERRLKIPAKQTTSLIFAGPDLTDIYITSACMNLNDQPPEVRGGGLFHLNLGIRGEPEFCSRLSA